MKKFYILFLFSFLVLTNLSWSQTTLSSWGFEAAVTTNTGVSPTFSSGNASADAGGALTAGALFSALHASATTVWSNPAGSGSTKSISCNGWTLGDYWQFKFSTTLFSGISISWAQMGSGTGPRDFTVQYSTDGTTFTNATGTNSTYALTTAFVTRTLDLSGVSGLNNQSFVYIRITETGTQNINGTGAFASTGTDRVDNFTVIAANSLSINDGDGTAVLSNVIGSGNLNNTLIFPANTGGQSVKVAVTGTTGGTLTSVSVTIPLTWGWDGSSVATTGDGASLTGLVVTGDGSSTPYTVKYSGTITNTNIARITISNLTSANPSNITDNGNYTFTVKTAKASGTLTSILASPVAYVIIPLSHIRNQSAGVPVLNLQYVASVGVATVASGVFATSTLQSYIQDATAGVNVFINSAPPTIVEGESYIVKGQVQQFNGNTELAPLSTADIIDNGASVLPAYQVVTVAALNANPENYEGKYIAVQNLDRNITSPGDGNWPTTAAAVVLTYNTTGIPGDSIHVNLFGTTDMHSNTEPAGTVDIKGIFSQLSTSGARQYALNPRYTATDFAGDWALPVELSSFYSNVNGRNVQLNWSTKTEKNSDKFIIERKSLDAAWTSVGSVKASVLSNSPKSYSFSDKNLNAGKYQYRLRMIDNDGSFNYSAVTEAAISLPVNFELSQNYPNPFNPSTKINYSLPSDSRVTLEVFNVLGVKVAQLVNKDQSAGYYSVDFNSSSLSKSISSGVYLYKISTVEKATGNSFSAIKKMMMLK